MSQSAAEDVGYVEEWSGGVLSVTFNRPDFGNAIPSAATLPLTTLFRAIAKGNGARVLLFRGKGKIFSAGGDVRNFQESLGLAPEVRQENFRGRLERLIPLVESFMAIDIPVVTACQGGVAGAALAYALGADVVLADETVNFSFSHQRVGLTPDGGVSALLPLVVGERKALELVLTAASVKAEEALRIGLVSRIVPAADLQAEALKLAQRLAVAPRNVVRTAKRLVRGAAHRSLADQLAAERDAIVSSVGHPDFEEGVRAFLEKRVAVFPSAADMLKSVTS